MSCNENFLECQSQLCFLKDAQKFSVVKFKKVNYIVNGVVPDTILSLRQVVRKLSIGNGQSFQKCQCQTETFNTIHIASIFS